MEQMQMTMLSILQATASRSSKRSESVKSGEGEDFRSMMEKQSKEPETKEVVTEKVETELPKEEELDETAMQELAAMQIFVADTMQIVTVAAEESAVGAEPVVFAAETVELPQQVMSAAGVSAAEMTASAAETGAEQIVEAEKIVETTVQQPAAEVVATDAEATAEKPVAEVAHSEGAEQKRSGAEAQQGEERFVEEVEVTQGEQKVFREVETAPIKVSETATEAETAESVKAQISNKLTQTLASGETRVELQLNPDHLGKITIELTKSSDGALHVSLFAENSQTRLMLERDMAGLQSLLHQNVREDVQVEMSHGQEAQQHESYEGHQQHSREQQQREERRQGEDFLNQLRLGLITPEEAAS